jgi:hypothetical protein
MENTDLINRILKVSDYIDRTAIRGGSSFKVVDSSNSLIQLVDDVDIINIIKGITKELDGNEKITFLD